jgi:predicted amidohydrolase YtcJ
MRAALAASTRGFWRNHGIEDCGTIEVGAWATLALWHVGSFEEQRVDPTIKRWSTDPRSGNQPLPNLEAGYPECLMTWKRGELIFERAENS